MYVRRADKQDWNMQTPVKKSYVYSPVGILDAYILNNKLEMVPFFLSVPKHSDSMALTAVAVAPMHVELVPHRGESVNHSSSRLCCCKELSPGSSGGII